VILDEIAAAKAAPAPVTAHDVLRILRRHAALALFTFAIVVAATLFLTSKMPRVYEANTSVLMDSVTPSSVGGGGLMDLLSGANLGTPMDTEIQKIKSRDFLSEVIARGKLQKTNPDDLRGRLNVTAGPGNQLLMIAMRGRTADDAVQGANWAARVYMDRTGRDFDQKTELSKSRLHRAETRALAEKKNAERDLNAFMARMGISDPGIYFNAQTAKTMEVRNILDDTKRSLDVQRAQLVLYDRQLKTLPPTVVGGYADNKNPVIDSYGLDIASLEAQRKLLLFDYQPDSDEVKAVDVQIDAKKRAIEEAKKNAYSIGSKSVNRSPDYAAAQTNYYNTALAIKTAQKLIAVKTAQLAELETEQRELAQKRSTYDGLRRAVEGATLAYEKSRAGLIQMDMSQVTSAPNVRVLDWAQEPREPISPKPILNIVMAVALGLILSVGMALITEYFRVGKESEAETPALPELPALSDFPNVGGIPILGAVSVTALPSSKNPASMAAAQSGDSLPLQPGPIEDALREVGYSLAHRHPGDAPPVVLLSGVRSDDSTASLAAHLAATLVRDGLRVTLVDADQAQPRLHRVFGAPDAPGMGDVLAGRVSDPRSILHVGAGGGLRFLAAGSTVTPPHAIIPAANSSQEEAQVDRLRLLFADLSLPDETDIVIVSGPAIWNVRAALPLEKATDGLVLVTPPDAPAAESLARARRLLSNGYKPRILGVVTGDSAAPVMPVALTKPTVNEKEG
jgi:succinoglycan biosynthesis transport protein ExoP